MKRAWVAEIDTDNGTRYLGPRGFLAAVPYFWQASQTLKWYLNRFGPERQLRTEIVETENLERGLRLTKATRMSVRQFLEKIPEKVNLAPVYLAAQARFSTDLASLGAHGIPPAFFAIGCHETAITFQWKCGPIRRWLLFKCGMTV